MLLKLLWLLRLVRARQTLRTHLRWTRQDVQLHQTIQLQALRAYAYAHSPFYQNLHRGLTNQPLSLLPILTKDELMENWNEIVADRSLSLAEVDHFLARLSSAVELLRNKYYVAATSGSSGLNGKRGVLVYTESEWLTILASYSRANDRAGIGANPLRRLRLANITTRTPWHQSAINSALLDSWFIPTLRLDCTDPLPEIVAKLNAFRPELLVAYPSMLRPLAEEQIKGELHIAPNAVITTGEVLTQETRELVKRAWNRDVFNIYGSTEAACIASECAAHRLHLSEDLLIIEVVDENNLPVPAGTYGAKILITVLFSRTIPLIRYELTDSICVSEEVCDCGLSFRVVNDMQGRTSEILSFEDQLGNTVSIKPIIFERIMEGSPVMGWQLVQLSKRALSIAVEPQSEFREENLFSRIRQELTKRGLGHITVHIEYNNRAQRGETGKALRIR